MATVSDLLDKFPTNLGTKRVTLEGYIRDLRANGMVAIGKRGGGKSAAHLNAEDLKNVILSLAGQQPSDAAAAVTALDGLVYDESRSTKHLPPMPKECRRFGDMIRLAIVKLLDPEWAAQCRQDKAYETLGRKSICITMSLNPLWARITTPAYGDRADWQEWFLPPDRALIDQPAPLGYRLFIIENGLLLEAADLLADTLAQHPAPTLIPEPSPGRDAEGSTNPETTKASGTGIHEGLQSSQPKHVRTALARTAHSNEAMSATNSGSKQLLSHVGACELQVCQQKTSLTRNRPHGSCWTDATSP